MKAPASFWFALGLGGVLLAGAWLTSRQVSGAIAAAAPKLTPASPENIVYKDLIGGVGRTIAQDETWTLGGWLAGVTGADQDARIKAMLDGAPPKERPAGYGELYL